MLTLATVAFMFITWLHLKKCNFPIRNLANHIPFAFVYYLSACTFHLHCQILRVLSTSFKQMAIFCKLIDLTSKKQLEMIKFLVMYIAMVTWRSINISFKNFWTSVKLVTIETLEAIQILSTFMNNWHDFPLLNPDIFIFWAEESSFHTTYFG